MQKDQARLANVAVSGDKTLAIITIGQATYKFDAKVLSEFLIGLMAARASIVPPVQTETPDTGGLSVRAENWGIATDPNAGDVLLGLPHPGFGWIGYRLSKESLQRLLSQLTTALETLPDPKAL